MAKKPAGKPAYDNELSGAFFAFGEDWLGQFELHGERRDVRVESTLRAGIYDAEGNVLAGFRMPRLPSAGGAPVRFELLVIGRTAPTRVRMVAFAASNAKHPYFVQVRRDRVPPVVNDPALADLLGE